ncbi:hypothetical protein LIX17_25295 (plasmid) [Mycobacterium avium subsp. hominissuis]|uniref:Uncharacterized protein n=1 Tax=Mycobacterium kiyosense TaxID=2871094 RepID=A0AA37V4V9_9MYCO|nr:MULTISPECIES: hypothetical protein [Mycobacterium]QWY65273.1 hypothetical protein BJP78_26680 [Mycobacterium avium subsp. hominissuis]GLB87002.1 hypothetical protein SRL2020028_62580 [Mycobacterium kiyosense]
MSDSGSRDWWLRSPRLPYVAAWALALGVVAALCAGMVTLWAGIGLSTWLVGVAAQLDNAAGRVLAVMALGALVGFVWLTYRLVRVAYSKTTTMAMRFGMGEHDPRSVGDADVILRRRVMLIVWRMK